MLPISPSADIADLGAGLDAEHAAQRAGVVAGNSSRTTASMSPTSGEHDAGDVLLGRADGVDGLGERQRRARWAREMSTARPSMLRQRGAGGAGADVGQLAQRVELEAR